VGESGTPTGRKLHSDASDLSGAESQEAGGFGLGSLTVEHRLHHLEHVTFTLAHLHTVPALYLDHLAPPSA
jgi:hypothetical protein